MQQLNYFMNRARSFVSLLVMFSFLCGASYAQTTHNISTGSLTIPGNSTNDYIITGTTTTNYVVVESGYKGKITLKNLSITLSSGSTSPFLVKGKDNQSNYDPVTNVDIVLEGTNELLFYGSVAAALQVNQGAQINISAIEPFNNASGSLSARAIQGTPGVDATDNPFTGAGIGGPNSNYAQGTSVIYDVNGNAISSGTPQSTAGGNIIINSGTITAYGGHGAGIGGGFQTWYNGIIIVTGGKIEARAGRHAAGLGSGCPTGYGVMPYYADKSATIALPPCEIEAYGADIGDQQSSLGLAGTKYLTYVNDPAKPVVTIRTEDYEKDANIYLDLSETEGMKEIFEKVHPTFNLYKVWIGRTGASDGLMKVHGLFQDLTTFFTDASSSEPATMGRPYMPVATTTSGAETIILPLFEAKISFKDNPSMPLEEGYAAAEAEKNAYCLKMEYNDDLPLTGLTYKLQQEAASDFKDLIFLAADSTTVVSPPPTLNKGDVYYIVTPIKQGKTAGAYTDVILIHGIYNAVVMAGYIRRISDQLVVKDDTENNDYIKVTASPDAFTTNWPTTETVDLTLNITHAGITGVPYDASDVTAKYLITTEQNYDDALAATPLSSWTDMTIPASDGSNAVTTASFSGMAADTYYIHWYVVSGIVMAHSEDVTNPADTYGGFGKYIINAGKDVTYHGNTHNSGAVPVDGTKYLVGDSATVLGNTGDLGKTDATFIGWSFGAVSVVTTAADIPSDLMVANDKFKVLSDTTLYAVWAEDKNGPGGGGDSVPDYLQFVVTYDGNGNTGGTAPVDANIYNSGDNVTAKTGGSLVRTGGADPILFAGWTPAPVNNVLTNATAADTTTAFVRPGGLFTITGDMTMYAVWSTDVNGNGKPDIFEAACDVVYDGNTNTGGTAPVDANEYFTGDNVIVLGNTSLTKTDATFIGWSFSAAPVVTNPGSIPSDLMAANDNFVVSTDVTLYAVWAEDKNGPGGGGDSIPDYLQFAVTYDGNGNTGGTAPADPNIYNSGDNVTLLANSFSKTKRVFLGWNPSATSDITSQTQEDGLTLMKDPGETFSITANTTWHAVWAIDDNGNKVPDYKEIDIEYLPGALDAMAVANLPKTVAVEKNSTIPLTDQGASASGYAIMGWHTNSVPLIASAAHEVFLTIGTYYPKGSTVTISGDLTLYAVWGIDGDNDGKPDHLKPDPKPSSSPGLRSGISPQNEAMSLRSGNYPDSWDNNFDKPAYYDSIYFVGCTYNADTSKKIVEDLITLGDKYALEGDEKVKYTPGTEVHFMVEYEGVLMDSCMIGGKDQKRLSKIVITDAMWAGGFTTDQLINHDPFMFTSIKEDGQGVLKMYFINPATDSLVPITDFEDDMGVSLGSKWPKPFKNPETGAYTDTMTIKFNIYNKPKFEPEVVSQYIDARGRIRYPHESGTPVEYMMRSINGRKWQPARAPLTDMEQLAVTDGVSICLREMDKTIGYQEFQRDVFRSDAFDKNDPTYMGAWTDLLDRTMTEVDGLFWADSVGPYLPSVSSNVAGNKYEQSLYWYEFYIGWGVDVDLAITGALAVTGSLFDPPSGYNTVNYATVKAEEDWPAYGYELADKVHIPGPCREVYCLEFETVKIPEVERYVEIETISGVSADPGAGMKHYVETRDDFTFTLTFSGGEPLKVMAEGYYSQKPEELIGTEKGGGMFEYVIRQVVEPWNVTVSSDPANGFVDNEVVGGTRVWAANGSLFIKSDKATTAAIYTMDGSLAKRLDVKAGETREAMNRGLYVVEIDGTSYKIMVK